MVDDNFFVIQGWMISKLRLKGNELLIYAIIYGFSQAEGTRFTGSLRYLQDWTQSSKQGVLNALQSLCQKGLLTREESYLKGVRLVYYRAVMSAVADSENGLPEGGGQLSLPVVNLVDRDSGQVSGQGVNLVDGGGQLSLPNNILDNIDLSLKEEKIEKEKKPDVPKPESKGRFRADQLAKYGIEFETFWSAYPHQIDKGGAFLKYKARRNEGFSAEELLAAAKNYAELCKRRKTEQEFIKHPKTFLSETLPFTDYIPKDLHESTGEEQPSSAGNPFAKYKRGNMLDG